jgi:phage antirepressor YoqD-like protein
MKKQTIPARVYDGGMSVADAAKELGIGQKALFTWLLNEKICDHDGRSYIADPKYVDHGWFKIKHKTWWSGGNEFNLQTVFVTSLGVEEIRKRMTETPTDLS